MKKAYDTSTDANDDDEEEENEEEMSSICDHDDDDGDKQLVMAADGTRVDHCVFVHVFDQVVQDSEAILAIISDILEQIKVNHQTIERAYIRCDNAVCYHSARTILSLPEITRRSKITIDRIDFSEPQNGKGIVTKRFLTRKDPQLIKSF
jgi:transposase